MGENKTTKSRLTFRPSDETRQRIEQWYKADNCNSLNDFIEKAVNDYIDRLEINDDNRVLPVAISSAIDGRIGMLEKKLSALSFNHAVELDIFHDEMHHLYEQKSESRDELVHEARKAMLEMVQYMKDGICDHPEAENLILELAMQLQNVSGKKSYGYLPKKQKALVDKIVDQMERVRSVSQAYDKWLELQNKVDGYYDDKPRERTPLSQQKEFRAIKNAVIKQAEHIWRCDLFFEDKGVEAESEPED
ncbi:MAG: hypothetical protein IJY85_10755, partial [Ruminococcus sp.]|nr:hypothetical protein [Ruminococcus sp.]